MTQARLTTGQIGENLAAKLLQTKGYKILARNLKNKLGEIDLLTEHKKIIVLVEVKTKRGLLFGLPQEMVNWHKQQKLRLLARWLEQQYPGRDIRVDVIAVNLEFDPPDIVHLEDVIGAE
ncbi:MAG: YraN family protein [Patescibacteria group bacterium]